MSEQGLHLPVLPLRLEVWLRRQLRLQGARASLKADWADQSPVLSRPGSGKVAEGSRMRNSTFLGSSMLLSMAVAILPVSPAVAAPMPTTPASAEAGLALAPPKAGRSRPLIAVVADKAGAQTTDFITPYGILKDSGVAEVRSLSTGTGPIKMTRGLRIVADGSTADFDASEPAGADIVIVPAQAQPKSPALVAWLRGQAAKGATIISVCEGARVLAYAGLLQGKRATSHWASLAEMTKAYPNTLWVRDRRYVQDGSIITTAGVTASIPMSLALVEAIAGRPAAQATASHFGVASWGPGHRTADFEILPSDRAAAAQAQGAPHETSEIPVEDGVDEVALGLQTEAWGRSLRTDVLITHPGKSLVRSRRGLTIVPDAEAKAGNHVIRAPSLPAIPELEATLSEIGVRYGPAVIRFALLSMEYDRPESGE